MEIKSIDREAFLELYELYKETVYQVALYYSKDENVAEEVTQETFLKLYANKDTVEPTYIKAWLKVTARNFTLNYNRDYTDKMEVTEKPVSKQKNVPYNSCEDVFFRKLMRNEHAELAKYILDEVYKKNARWHEALTLIFVEDKSYAEAAESMKISVGALNVMLHRIRKWIRKRYQKQFDHLDSI